MICLFQEDVLHATSALYYHSMCLHDDLSAKAMIGSVKVLSENSLYVIIKFLNKIMKGISKHVTVHFPTTSIKLSIHNTWKFKVLLISGLKYVPLNLNLDKPILLEIESLLCTAVSLLDIRKHPSVYLFDAIKYALTIPNQRLSPFTVWKFINTFIKIINLNATFRKHVEEIVRTSVKLLPSEPAQVLFTELNQKIEWKTEIPCFLVGEILKNSYVCDTQNYSNQLCVYIFDGFTSNIDSVQRSYIYNGLLQNITFERWLAEILPLFLHALEKYSDE